MNKDIKRTLEEKKWTRLIQEFQSSSLTVSEFAHQSHVGQRSLYTWAKRLGLSLKHQPQANISFIELGALSSHKQETTEYYPIEMGINHFTIKAEVPWYRLIELVKEFQA
ncbi:MAG: hypothetical protein ACD_44C00228G0002 [uncultured bacterium]|nr:MAG: hypothetical protein ACD_44C00228G0002 [uncultured bacterium]